MATGLTEVADVVEKFLTKEGQYAQLLKTVGNVQERINNIRNSNAEIESNIRMLRISEKNDEVHSSEQAEISILNRQLEETRAKH